MPSVATADPNSCSSAGSPGPSLAVSETILVGATDGVNVGSKVHDGWGVAVGATVGNRGTSKV